MVPILVSFVKQKVLAKPDRVPYNPALTTMDKKDDRIGVRLPAELKRTLIQIANSEGRSLAQVCELLLRAGIASYKKEGPKYFLRFITQRRPKSKDP